MIVAAISLCNLPALRHLWNVWKSEFVLAVICVLGVGLVDVLAFSLFWGIQVAQAQSGDTSESKVQELVLH